MNVAIIPARGGSKRIPRKNIRSFCGQAMITYSIQAALDSQCFDKIIVSTDDKEIAEIAVKSGAEVPFFRPSSLSNDYIGTNAVIKHAIEWLEENSSSPELVCCIYATAPFVNATDIKQGLTQLIQSDCQFSFSVTSFPFPIQRALHIQDDRVAMFQPDQYHTRSQDLEEAYHDAGQFYWGRTQAWKDELAIFDSYSTPVILPRYKVQDIDTEEDWIRAEYMYHALIQAQNKA